MGPGGRFAYAARARYTPDEDVLTLTGSPRIVDGGMTVTANTRADRAAKRRCFRPGHGQDHLQRGATESGRSDSGHHGSGARNLQQHECAEAIGHSEVYGRSARLWQGANVVEAPSIEFDRPNRSLVAQGSGLHAGDQRFRADRQEWKDHPGGGDRSAAGLQRLRRRAHYTGGVLARGEGMTMTSSSADVILVPAGEKSAQVRREPQPA